MSSLVVALSARFRQRGPRLPTLALARPSRSRGALRSTNHMSGSAGATAPSVYLVPALRPRYARSTPVSAFASIPDSRVDDAVDQVDEKVHCRQEHTVEQHHRE